VPQRRAVALEQVDEDRDLRLPAIDLDVHDIPLPASQRHRVRDRAGFLRRQREDGLTRQPHRCSGDEGSFGRFEPRPAAGGIGRAAILQRDCIALMGRPGSQSNKVPRVEAGVVEPPCACCRQRDEHQTPQNPE
jgi:hypothetical protein